MDRPRSSHAPLRYYRDREGGFFHAGEIPPQLVEGCVRIRGYLFAAFGRGADFIIWDKHAFARRSMDKSHARFKRGYQVEYVEKLMRTFRKTTTEFKVEEIRRRRPDGKTSPRLKITMLSRSAGCPIERIRGRLLGYIRGSVRIHGWVKVDSAFISHFIATTGAPAEIVAQVWQALKFVPGCRAHWKGCGANIKLVVSLQHCSLPHSFPSGRRYEYKTMAPAAPGDEQSGPSAQPVGLGGKQPTHPSRHRPPWSQRTPARSNPRSTTKWASAIERLQSPSGPGARGSPLAEPFRIDAHWISGVKILRFATWLAVEPMQAVHGTRAKVRWRFAHARNFAARALRFGHGREAILAAYQAGVQRSHDDAGMAGETARDHAPREPSAAVNYAWRELLADTRSRDDRWRSIIAGERPARMERVRIAAPITENVVHVAAAPAEIDDAHLPTLEKSLVAHLAAHKMTVQEYDQLPWADKKRILQSVIEQQVQHAKNNK